jgi:hypothetical protein
MTMGKGRKQTKGSVTGKLPPHVEVYAVDCYVGVEERIIRITRKDGAEYERRSVMRLFRWTEGGERFEGNCVAFAEHVARVLDQHVHWSAIHAALRALEGKPLRDGTKGKGIGSHAGTPTARAERIGKEGEDA